MEDMVGFSLVAIDVQDAPHAKSIIVQHGKIDFEKISFAYEKNTPPVFQNFDLHINPKEKVALVGYSGSGKTTITKIIQRLYDVQSGSVKIDGQDIRSVTQESLRKNIALVSQDPLLFHRSLAENIAYGHPNASRKEIEHVARLAHAHEFIAKLPHGYETLVGERGVKLSGGERQRVAIARAMLADCPILILDEATSSLDSESEKFIQEALRHLLVGKTAIIIAHRLSTIKAVDRILVFENGVIIEEGDHAELLKKNSGIYKKLYELQSEGFVRA
jgi:ATP-binding cassette subfamily B protein